MKILMDVIASKTAAKKRRCSKQKKQKGHVVARRVLFPTKQSPRKDIILILLLFLTACAPAVQIVSTSEVINIYATSAAQPWLTKLYDCAAKQAVTLRLTDSPTDAAIYIRIGEPDVLMNPAYQIDTEELLIVTHRESPVKNLTLEEARTLFAGQGDPSVKVWVYSSDEDIQKVFEQAVMAGRSVTSSASLAVSPGQMSDVLNAESNAVGILPRHWKAGTVRDVYSAGIVPVLAIVKEKPQGIIKEILSCLQRQS